MSGEMDAQATLARAREMITTQGKPMTAENLNRAMLAIAQGGTDAGAAATDFDNAVEASLNEGRAPTARTSAPARGTAATPAPITPVTPAVPVAEASEYNPTEYVQPQVVTDDRAVQTNPSQQTGEVRQQPGTGDPQANVQAQVVQPIVVAAPVAAATPIEAAVDASLAEGNGYESGGRQQIAASPATRAAAAPARRGAVNGATRIEGYANVPDHGRSAAPERASAAAERERVATEGMYAGTPVRQADDSGVDQTGLGLTLLSAGALGLGAAGAPAAAGGLRAYQAARAASSTARGPGSSSFARAGRAALDDGVSIPPVPAGAARYVPRRGTR